jgi:hypothetical protein
MNRLADRRINLLQRINGLLFEAQEIAKAEEIMAITKHPLCYADMIADLPYETHISEFIEVLRQIIEFEIDMEEEECSRALLLQKLKQKREARF